MRLTAAAVGGFLAISTSFAVMAQNALPEIPAEELAKLDAVCAQTVCRPDRKMILNLDAKRTMEANFARTPYVDKNGVLFAYPGEMLVFKVEADGKTIRPPVFVRLEQVPVGDVSTLDDRGRKAATDHDKDHPEAMAQYLADIKAGMGMNTRLEKAPPGTLFVFYRQIPNGPDMILETGHNLGGVLKFEATIARPTREGFHFEHTSTCGAVSGLGAIETWPYPIGPIMLENFTLTPGRSVTCE